MNSATIKIPEEMFFELIGLEYFDGHIEDISIIFDCERMLNIRIQGEDDRLPKRVDFPYSNVIAQRIESFIKETT
jgi:hypothetical protein